MLRICDLDRLAHRRRGQTRLGAVQAKCLLIDLIQGSVGWAAFMGNIRGMLRRHPRETTRAVQASLSSPDTPRQLQPILTRTSTCNTLISIWNIAGNKEGRKSSSTDLFYPAVLPQRSISE